MNEPVLANQLTCPLLAPFVVCVVTRGIESYSSPEQENDASMHELGNTKRATKHNPYSDYRNIKILLREAHLEVCTVVSNTF
jgi:hypothetical protein